MKPLIIAVFGVSWKTTLSGYIVAIALAVVDYLAVGIDLSTPQKQATFWAGLVAAIGIAVKGRLTKDENVTHAPEPVPPTPVDITGELHPK